MDEANQSILEIIEANAPDTGTYAGGLFALLPLMPIIATIISIITLVGFKIQAPHGATGISWVEALIPILVGTLSALLLWLLLAFPCRRFTAVDRAHANSYYGLLNHLSSLNASIDAVLPEDTKKETLEMLRRMRQPQPSGSKTGQAGGAPPLSGGSSTPPLNTVSAQDAMQEVSYCRNAICLALIQRSTSWIVGNGYTQLWDWIDRAEEALIDFAPQEKVVGDAVSDEMRLNDSNIANSEEWTNKLRSAVKMLNPDAVRYLKPAVGTYPLTQGMETLQQASQGKEPSPPPTNQASTVVPPQQDQARAILRKVRETINGFNTKSWDGLVNARNQLLATMILVGLATYVFVELAILMQAKTSHIVVATIIAFIGALAGLIGRLSLESQTGMAIDDYHLSTARLFVTPLLSALAAVIGVLIVAKASNLDQIYTFNAIVSNLIIAATFGLTPNLLINQLQKKADEYKDNLQSTKPTSGK